MMRKGVPSSPPPIASRTKIWLLSLVAGGVAFTITLILQWLVYDDWMHWNGPLRVVGSTLAGALAFMFAAHWQGVWQRRKIEMLRRFEAIARMNDSIRNALQAIQCIDYAANSRATESVQNAVRTIDSVLKEVLSEAHPGVANRVHGTSISEYGEERVTSSSAFCDSEAGSRCGVPALQ